MGNTTVKRVSDHGLPLPAAGNPESAALEVLAAEDTTFIGGEVNEVSTGFVWNIPHGYVGLFIPSDRYIDDNLIGIPKYVPADQDLFDDDNELHAVFKNLNPKKELDIEKGSLVGHVSILAVHSLRGVREMVNPDLIVKSTEAGDGDDE